MASYASSVVYPASRPDVISWPILMYPFEVFCIGIQAAVQGSAVLQNGGKALYQRVDTMLGCANSWSSLIWEVGHWEARNARHSGYHQEPLFVAVVPCVERKLGAVVTHY